MAFVFVSSPLRPLQYVFVMKELTFCKTHITVVGHDYDLGVEPTRGREAREGSPPGTQTRYSRRKKAAVARAPEKKITRLADASSRPDERASAWWAALSA